MLCARASSLNALARNRAQRFNRDRPVNIPDRVFESDGLITGIDPGLQGDDPIQGNSIWSFNHHQILSWIDQGDLPGEGCRRNSPHGRDRRRFPVGTFASLGFNLLA